MQSIDKTSLPVTMSYLQVVGSELSRPAGYPDRPLLRTGLAELPHPAPDRPVGSVVLSSVRVSCRFFVE
ncbi:hypothetical protein [Xenorhabdus bovienii]|uniref:hypothetical protein n=1 Tax=Xenorhabdus bovienii TaxID=40576 RepID=UPI0023B269EF|nr:hypothetical protein [Xenorhabdus bovienii]MDE9553224.1 hypothetical protein [Xenorhabdus bovienii]